MFSWIIIYLRFDFLRRMNSSVWRLSFLIHGKKKVKLIEILSVDGEFSFEFNLSQEKKTQRDSSRFPLWHWNNVARKNVISSRRATNLFQIQFNLGSNVSRKTEKSMNLDQLAWCLYHYENTTLLFSLHTHIDWRIKTHMYLYTKSLNKRRQHEKWVTEESFHWMFHSRNSRMFEQDFVSVIRYVCSCIWVIG